MEDEYETKLISLFAIVLLTSMLIASCAPAPTEAPEPTAVPATEAPAATEARLRKPKTARA